MAPAWQSYSGSSPLTPLSAKNDADRTLDPTEPDTAQTLHPRMKPLTGCTVGLQGEIRTPLSDAGTVASCDFKPS